MDPWSFRRPPYIRLRDDPAYANAADGTALALRWANRTQLDAEANRSAWIHGRSIKRNGRDRARQYRRDCGASGETTTLQRFPPCPWGRRDDRIWLVELHPWTARGWHWP